MNNNRKLSFIVSRAITKSVDFVLVFCHQVQHKLVTYLLFIQRILDDLFLARVTEIHSQVHSLHQGVYRINYWNWNWNSLQNCSHFSSISLCPTDKQILYLIKISLSVHSYFFHWPSVRTNRRANCLDSSVRCHL